MLPYLTPTAGLKRVPHFERSPLPTNCSPLIADVVPRGVTQGFMTGWSR